jgi:hypothetical protein
MTTGVVWPIHIASLGDEACATIVYCHRGVHTVAIVVKATFAFVPEGEMLRVPTEPIAVAEEHYEHDPLQSVRVASDLVPYRPHADVLVRGFACTHRGRPAPWLTVRLQVIRGDTPVLDKQVVVHGAPDPASPGQRIPFMRAPLRWELAYGGDWSAENPVGSTEARIFDPRQWDRPAGFGAVARGWPVRQQRLGALDAERLHASWAEIPDEFPWAYFSAAPPDQCIPFVAGDEWILLEGMSPHHPRLRSRLPGAHAEARLYGLLPDPGLGQPVRLVADTLSIDADTRRCSVVWRGSFPIADLHRIRALKVLAGVAAGQPVAFPERCAPPEPDDDDVTTELAPRLLGALSGISPPPQAAVAEAAPQTAHTADLSPDLVAHLARAPATPFAQAPVAPADDGWGPGTVVLADEVMAALAAAPTMPFANRPPAFPPPVAPPAPAPAAHDAGSGVESPHAADPPADMPALATQAELPLPAPAPEELQALEAPIEADEQPLQAPGEAFLAGMEWAHGPRDDAPPMKVTKG